MARLTPLTVRRAHSRIVYPYIIKARKGMLERAIEAISELEVSRVLESLEILKRIRGILPFGTALGLRVHRTFDMISGIFPRDTIWEMENFKEIETIYPDEVKYALRFPTVPPEGVFIVGALKFTSTKWVKRLVGAEKANEEGYRGRGVKVAVLDTGVRKTHDQLEGKVDTYTTMRGQFVDDNGHGSWVASAIAGREAVDSHLSRLSGKTVVCEGMAPDSRIISIKCLGYVVGMGSDSTVISAIERAIALGADIINMSLGAELVCGGVLKQEDDPYYPVFQKVTDMGIIPIVASGNSGPNEGTINSPAWLPNVLAVGALDPIKGEVAEYSSRGPTPDGRIKPDCVAPGSYIDSGTVAMCDLATDKVQQRFSPISGTSMATSIVTGLIALMKQYVMETEPERNFTLKEVFEMLEKTATEEKNNDYGWGLITWDRFKEYIGIEGKPPEGIGFKYQVA